MRVTGISGSPSTPSRSRALVEQALGALQDGGCDADLIDLATLPAEALLARGRDPLIEAAVASVGEASIIVVGTPVYRATYTGLLKCFFDLMPQDHLRGKVAVLLATGAGPAHALALDHGLRPLIASLAGLSIANAVYAVNSEFDDQQQPTDSLAVRVGVAAGEALALARALTDDGAG